MPSCFECGDEATFQHHVVPESLGGTKTVPLCGICHPKAHGESGHWKLSELIRARFKAKKDAGLWVCGPVPYGKQVENNQLVDNPEHQKWVAWMVEQNKNGLPASEIAKELRRLGVPGKNGKPTWTSHTVCRTIRYNTGVDPINWRTREARGLPIDPKQEKRKARLVLRKKTALSHGS